MQRPIDATTLRAEFTGNFNGGYYTVAEIKAIIDTAPTLDKDINVPGKWVSVEDRMPEPPCQCLIYSDKAFRPSGMETATYTEFGWMTAAHFPKVTHWMPLPEPPEEDDDGSN